MGGRNGKLGQGDPAHTHDRERGGVGGMKEGNSPSQEWLGHWRRG
jgi:hypothetical protein